MSHHQISFCVLKISFISPLPFSQNRFANSFTTQVITKSLVGPEHAVGVGNSTWSEQNASNLCPFGAYRLVDIN